MVIRVPKEIKPEENRIAIVPGGVETLIHRGHRILIENNAGLGSGFSDQEFIKAEMKDTGETYALQASMAKLLAPEMVNRITAQAVQLHGAYGFTKEYAVERYYRDARVFTIYEGTSEIQRIVISNHVLKDKRNP